MKVSVPVRFNYPSPNSFYVIILFCLLCSKMSDQVCGRDEDGLFDRGEYQYSIPYQIHTKNRKTICYTNTA